MRGVTVRTGRAGAQGQDGTRPPCVDLRPIEAEQVAPLDERDAALVDEASRVADLDVEEMGHLGDGEQLLDRLLGVVVDGDDGHGFLLVLASIPKAAKWPLTTRGFRDFSRPTPLAPW